MPERYDDAALILVVEDEPRDQQEIARALNGVGYSVEVAAGRQATDACRERTYDAITLDLLLPDESGLEVLRELRSDGLNRQTPVIVVSVVAERRVIEGFSVHDYLPKPIEGGKLIESLESAGITPNKAEAVLVVDDDPSSLKLMHTTLLRLGFAAECQSDPARALDIARTQRHSAVILDLLMPGMDGFEFIRRFREQSSYEQVPVIVWTTKDLTADDHRRLKRDAQAIFEKGQRPAFVAGRRAPLVAGTADREPREEWVMTTKRVLVVDDNATILKLVTCLLGTEPCQVTTAGTGHIALEILRRDKPDLLLLDLQLPDLDGLELTRIVRANPETRDLPIIAVTAYAMNGDEAKAREAGVDAYVAKPIDKRIGTTNAGPPSQVDSSHVPRSSRSRAAGWKGRTTDGHGVDTGDVGAAAIGALERMRSGVATTGEVAKLAAEVLANPPALMVAARRYLNAVGTEHEGAAAVAFLALLAGDHAGCQDVASRVLP